LRWQRQRQAFAPLFSAAAAVGMAPLFRTAAEQAMAEWGAANEIEIDAGFEMTQITLGIIWRVLFGADIDAAAPRFVTAAARAIYDAQLRGDIDAPAAKISELADAARDVAATAGLPAANPFRAWAPSTAGDPARLADQELYDNARNFLAAGHETTALTLIWSLWLTAQDPDTQDRIYREIDAVVGSGPIEDNHIDHLAFVGRVIKEAMRLFPPGFVTVRRAGQPATLAGESLPAGSILVVCIYALHRHRDWWDAPNLFRPERFATGEPRHRYAYLPFSAGPHACIGARFAWREVIVLFASILLRFRLSTDPHSAIRPRAGITIRPDREVRLMLERRKPTGDQRRR
jgi:cytochrome P450